VTATFDDEIREQPAVLSRLLAEGRARVDEAAGHIRTRAPAFVVLAARGSSDNAARYAQYLFGVRNGLMVALAAPSIVTRYGATPRLGAALVIGISQSGQSPDVVAVLEEARRQGASTLALTNDDASPLAQAAEFTLPLLAGQEHAVAATKTYSAQLMALAMLSAALDGSPAAWEELQATPGQVAAAISLNEAVSPAVRFWRAEQMVVLGRGYNLSTAFEIALKLKETCGLLAEPYSSADFLHGPVALLDQDLPVMVIAPSTASFEDLEAVIERARKQGAPLLAVSDAAALLAGAETPLRLPPGVPEWLSPIVAVVPGQVFAGALAAARGMSPDAPPGLTKVTRTR
jgi:glucosamine--fructose-6-phosphate aminotransferase (isomerizing)